MIQPGNPTAGNSSSRRPWSLARHVAVSITASLLLVLGLLSLTQPDSGHTAPINAVGTVGTFLLLALSIRRGRRYRGRHRRSTKDGVQ